MIHSNEFVLNCLLWLGIVTICTADQNNGISNGNLTAICDSSITMMHNNGLDAQLPQVDMYLKQEKLQRNNYLNFLTNVPFYTPLR